MCRLSMRIFVLSFFAFLALTFGDRAHGAECRLAFHREKAAIRQPIPKDVLYRSVTELLQKHPEYELDRIKSDVYQGSWPNSGQSILYVPGQQMGSLMNEIGRLREISFRAEGEGSGLSEDIDSYDAYYRHMFIWDWGSKSILGAYRMGVVEEILRLKGVEGIYTHQFFKYDAKLFDLLGPSLEMGRSFVAIEYQNSTTVNVLRLLWQGVGLVLYHYPHIRAMFGPVSISGEYKAESQSAIVEFVLKHFGPAQHPITTRVAEYLRPQNPFIASDLSQVEQFTSVLNESPNLKKLDEVILKMEENPHKKVPNLIRNYVGLLSSLILKFNRDPDFNAIDGFVVTLVDRIPDATYRAFLGAERASTIRNRQRQARINEDNEQ
jgi:putative hemolysin